MKRGILTAIIWISVCIGGAVNALAVFSAFATGGLWGGLDTIQTWFSPYNVVNLLAEAVLFSPALICLWLRTRLDEKRSIVDAARPNG